MGHMIGFFIELSAGLLGVFAGAALALWPTAARALAVPLQSRRE